MADPQYLNQIARKLADEGKIIEAGWVTFRAAVMPQHSNAIDLEAIKLAFMAGAQHLWGSINMMMDEDHDVTEADLRRMTLIHDELEVFYKELSLRWVKPGGSA